MQALLLPGTLLAPASLAPIGDALLASIGLPYRTAALGIADSFDAELQRLAATLIGPTLLIGHSLGGIVALHLALRCPQHVRAVVTLASTARADTTSGRARRMRQRELVRHAGLPALVQQELLPLYAADRERAPQIAWPQWLQAQAAGFDEATLLRQLRYADERGSMLHCALGIPVLALAGQLDLICPTALSQEIATLGAPGRCEVLPGVGHLFPIYRATDVAERIAALSMG